MTGNTTGFTDEQIIKFKLRALSPKRFPRLLQDILTWALSGGASVASESTAITDEGVSRSTRIQEKPELQVRRRLQGFGAMPQRCMKNALGIMPCVGRATRSQEKPELQVQAGPQGLSSMLKDQYKHDFCTKP